MIQFESVSKTFRDGTTAVDDLSLTVPSGQITVIVGPSGCGKTTTLRMVNRMLEPSKGKVTWDGKPIKSRRKTALRRQMGYVIQSGGLFPHRTVLENIATVPDLQRWDKQKTRKRALELLGSVGLDRKLGDRYPAQLSGGQQQRVGVARALAADPLVLLMDEPFSAVDPVVRAELHEFFLNLQRDLSKTIIMITHDIDEAIKLGDQVAILRVGGRLAQVGTPQQLLDEPADSFVEGFVGRDRGYRSLSFQPASGLALGGVQVVREAGYHGGDEPVLVVDGDARPVGWSDPSRPGSMLALGATFDPESDSLRAALDAALTSPVGLAVAVSGEAHRYAGVVDADMILRQVTRTRAQIAESIAVRAHDERQVTGDQVTGDQRSADGAGSLTAPAGSTPPGVEDPDATSVRGVPPVAAVGSVGAVAGASAGVDTAPADEDPDATRISGPLPDQAQGSGEETEVAPWTAGERPDESAQWDDQAPTTEGPSGLVDEGLATPTGAEPSVDERPATGSETAAGTGSADAADQGRGDEPFQDPEPFHDPEPSRDAEPYANQWPPAGDESFGTAYDRQLADDEAAPAPSQDPYDTPLAADPSADGEAAAGDQRPPADDHDHVGEQAATEDHTTGDDPAPAEEAPPADQPSPFDRPGPTDHERGWPR